MNLTCPNCQQSVLIDQQESDLVTCPECGFVIDLLDMVTATNGNTPIESGKTFSLHLADEPESFEIGDKLGRFSLVGRLGQGGFGSVFEAYDSNLDRNVAIKIPKSDQMSQVQAKLFLREARLAAKLQDPNIVSVFEVGRDYDRKVFFIVSELIRGETLRKWARRQKRSQREIAQVMETITRAVHRAHVAGIIHRDLKPGNVLIDSGSTPHITDFGLAKQIGGGEFTIARDGNLVGTLVYMSPEQADGSANHADARTDVYALGVMLYVLLSGKKPFITTSNSILEDIISGKAIPLREFTADVNRDLESICAKAMAKEPDDRYQTAEELADDLNRFLNQQPVTSRKRQFGAGVMYAARRNWILIAVFAALVLVGVAAWVLKPVGSSQTGSAIQVHKTECFAVVLAMPKNAQEIRVRRVQYNKFGTLSPNQSPVKSADRRPAGEHLYGLIPGLYHIDFLVDGASYAFYRYILTDRNRVVVTPGYLRDSQQDTDEKIFRVQPLEIHKPVKNPDGTYQLDRERMVVIKGGPFVSGSDQRRMNLSGRSELRFPERNITVETFLISETEVLAENFRRVMGNYPMAMRSSAPFPPGTVAWGVTWDEAVEYCERIGGRLPTFDEYLFVATNRGETDFPWGNEFKTGIWAFGPAGFATYDNAMGVKGLYSNYGEWLWDANLDGPLSIGMEFQEPGSLKWHDQRVAAGISVHASTGESEVKRIESGPQRDSPSCIFSIFGDAANQRIGFRVVCPLPKRQPQD